MATTKTPDKLDYPVTFEVTNTGKRTRHRSGRNIVAATGDDKPKPVVIEVSSRAEYLRLKGCKDLQLKPTTAKASGDGDPLADDHTAEQLREMAADRDLATSGTKAELADRIREHDAGADGGGQ